MVEDTLGSGLYLDENLDFDVGAAGDLRGVSGTSELEKDLSFQLLIVLDDMIGQPLTPDTRAEVKSLTVDTITSDTRVSSINRSAMQVRKPDRNSLSIQAPVTAGGVEQELIFTL